MSDRFLIYGANGYTGELITRLAVERGLKPILAGRSEAKVAELAAKHSLEYRTFALDVAAAVDAALEAVDAVLHCAGPFSITSRPMAEACIRNKKHYADITGEISVFEACAALDKQAREAGVMVMPGVGFDVVPSDCLAVHLKNRLPSATHLSLAFYSSGRMSHGTQATMTMNVGRRGAVRANGKIKLVPAAWKTREIDFGSVTKTGVTIPWGDVATAYRSTNIPNIEVYTVVPRDAIRLMKISRYLGWLLATRFAQRFLQANIQPGGPTDAEREKGRTLMWGEVKDDEGNVATSLQQGPEAYTLTAHTALNVVERILRGDFAVGYQTPAMAYGPGLILELDGVARQDL